VTASVDLPVRPPVAPMLARLSRELPQGGFVYEPKWDGFRCLVFGSGRSVDLRSRGDRPLTRYFPELVAAIRELPEAVVLDGEIVIPAPGGFDFTTLLLRLHPSASRIERLAAEAPAWLIAFDLLAVGPDDLRARSFKERRARLERLLASAAPPLHVSPVTPDPAQAMGWLDGYAGAGIDGVVAKSPGSPYEPGRRTMVKVKPVQTAWCLVAGARLLADRPLPSSLLLGLNDDRGRLHHVGLASGFSERRRRELLDEIRPLVVPIDGHPWERGFLLEGGPMGRLPGAAAGWSPELRDRDWIPLSPAACEIAYDHVDAHRLRHPARFRRWLEDIAPDACTIHQFDAAPGDARRLLERA
jgi:ATP-dependent DNA ligase